MIYKIIRHDKESDDITQQLFNSYDEAYDLLEEIYSDVCCSGIWKTNFTLDVWSRCSIGISKFTCGD